MPPHKRSAAFAPGRVNLIGEHTDYNAGLALPFAITEGVVVRAETIERSPGKASIRACAADFAERDEFTCIDPPRTQGWRAFVRGVVAELGRAGCSPKGARLAISGRLAQGAGLSSSAALEVALCLALIDLWGAPDRGFNAEGGLIADDRSSDGGASSDQWHGLDRMGIARLCSRVENDWVGAQTGLLDQIASLYGAPATALCIDFRSLSVKPVPLVLGDWRLVVLDSGEQHTHVSSGYNQRRLECVKACEMLAVGSLAEAGGQAIAGLPQPLADRAAHVLGENERVRAAVAALATHDLPALGRLLDASHASLRDLYEVSTPALETAVARLRDAGAAGARLMGGGFGGAALGLFAPDRQPPSQAREVRPGPGAHLLPVQGDHRQSSP